MSRIPQLVIFRDQKWRIILKWRINKEVDSGNVDWIQLALWVCSALHLLIRILLPNKAIGKYVMYPVFVDSKMWVFGEFVVHASVCTSPPICSVISVSAMLARFLPNHCSYSFQGQGWRCRWQSDCAHTNCFGMGGIRSWLVSESPGVDLGCYRMLDKWLTYYHFKTKGYNALYTWGFEV